MERIKRLGNGELMTIVTPVKEQTRGQDVLNKIYTLAHEAQHLGEASPLIVAALELCEEYEAMARKLESAGKMIEELRRCWRRW